MISSWVANYYWIVLSLFCFSWDWRWSIDEGMHLPEGLLFLTYFLFSNDWIIFTRGSANPRSALILFSDGKPVAYYILFHRDVESKYHPPCCHSYSVSDLQSYILNETFVFTYHHIQPLHHLKQNAKVLFCFVLFPYVWFYFHILVETWKIFFAVYFIAYSFVS